jgi:uncharacterized membrane protein YfcA
VTDFPSIGLVFAAGVLGGGMNALAGGGTFATLPALIAFGLPANMANATSNVALVPGAAASAWTYRDELGPVGGMGWPVLASVTGAMGFVGSLLLVLTPSDAFDIIIPWLLLFAFFVMLFGRQVGAWLRARTTIGVRTLLVTQALLGIYGGYFGGGVGLIATAVYGLLAGINPREMFALRTLMLMLANLAAALVFIACGLVDWMACLPMLAGGIAGGWLGAQVGRRLDATVVRGWTLAVTGGTTIIFFLRAYG